MCPLDGGPAVHTIAGNTTISGRYILERRLGQGGMGIVFRAKHKFLKSAHAVKIILPSLVADDKDLLVRFNQEAVLAASIDHPNVIRVTDFGVENDDMPFLVMEFIDGIPLSNYLLDDKPLALSDAMGLFVPVAEGVAQAHSKGIVHRDLKPQNIMVQKDLPVRKAVKVLDFGLAKIKSADSYPSLIQAKTMSIVGSPPYMSPEQWSGDGVDHRTDIYALAVILYQMLTGHLPFQADTMPAMMYQHLTVAPPTAESWGVSLSPDLERIVQKGLEKEPDKRYDSMDEMLAELERALKPADTGGLSAAVTEYMIPRASLEAVLPRKSAESPLTDSQKEKFYGFFDSKDRPDTIGDPKLAHELLDAQEKIESAKTEAINADLLVQELAEAQKQAEEAQIKAQQAKDRIEADVRRKVEAEMERLALEDQTKREAEAERLTKEVEARRAAEERANYLAQAALEAQQQAEVERKKREEEAQQREVHQGVREKAEIEARQLAQQVAEARKQYEQAREEAAREAQARLELEQRQKKIEDEIQILTYNEAEQRKLVEASAKKYIEEQAARFETEAKQAQQRLDEAKVLIDQEAEKREAAEAARLQAEKEAERLSQQIIEVQRQMEEMQQHITSDVRSQASLQGISHPTMPNSGSSLAPIGPGSGIFNTGEAARKPFFAIAGIGGVLLLLLIGGATGLYLMFGRASPPPEPNANAGPADRPADVGTPGGRNSVLLEAGTFMMGRNVADPTNREWGNQYPEHSETVGRFYIDVNETTIGEYAEFVAAKPHAPPKTWPGGKPPADRLNYPVTSVSLDDAKDYALWVSTNAKKTCRLPTEVEWEYAARNLSSSTKFPWGNEWLPDRAVLGGTLAPVGTSQDRTQAGVFDMLGNVAEWTSSPYALYKGHPESLSRRTDDLFVVRGLYYRAQKELPAAFKNPDVLLTYRQSPTADGTYDTLGFRLVCDP